MSATHTVYCDESGNDGPNYLSPDQPFYVLAGWIAPNGAIVEATLILEKLRIEHCNNSPEIKFRLLRNKMQVVHSTFEELASIGLIPVYVIAEKRFCIAAKIVETFLDPAYNPLLADAFTIDLHTKRELANTFYDNLPQDTLEAFAREYRSPTVEGLREVLIKVANECKACVNPEVAALIEGSLPNISEIAREEVNAVETWGKGMGTINVPCLIAFLMHIEAYCSRNEIECRVVHDEQAVYEDDYKLAYEMYHGPRSEPLLIEGMRVPFSRLSSILDFEMQESLRQPMVQAADTLAGSLSLLSKKLLKHEELHPLENELARLLLPVLFIGEPELSLLICSSAMQRKLRSAVADIVPEVAYNIDESIPGVIAVSSLSNEEYLPIFPTVGKKDSSPLPGPRFAIDLPLYSLADTAEGRLCLLLPPDLPLEATSRDQRVVPLFSTRALAEQFLELMEWSTPHDVVEFGVPELNVLLDTLREATDWTDRVAIVTGENSSHPMPINMFISDVERIIERIRRAVVSGVSSSLVKYHVVSGKKAISMLLSSGEYAAAIPPYGRILRADTREAALALLENAINSGDYDLNSSS